MSSTPQPFGPSTPSTPLKLLEQLVLLLQVVGLVALLQLSALGRRQALPRAEGVCGGGGGCAAVVTRLPHSRLLGSCRGSRGGGCGGCGLRGLSEGGLPLLFACLQAVCGHVKEGGCMCGNHGKCE
eukprot:352331-Chlamydomonas_euryale.AAC.8